MLILLFQDQQRDAEVIRDGKQLSINCTELVVGDLFSSDEAN